MRCNGKFSCLLARFNTEFLENTPQMFFDCAFGDAEFVGNFFVRERNKPQYIPLTGGDTDFMQRGIGLENSAVKSGCEPYFGGMCQ